MRERAESIAWESACRRASIVKALSANYIIGRRFGSGLHDVLDQNMVILFRQKNQDTVRGTTTMIDQTLSVLVALVQDLPIGTNFAL